MDQPFQAIYEHGILRPLSPLNLNEDEVVSLIITGSPNYHLTEPSANIEAERQREVITQFVAKMESLTDNTPQDGMTNRDHDRLIYGS
jgi:predicted DNA-binding antitoxin AbrB/MazE fold protein